MISEHSAAYWKNRYNLQPHPEGGLFREIYRSKLDIHTPWKQDRSASTSIIYMLVNQEKSCFHRLKSDELWHLYDANTSLNIHCLDPNGTYSCLQLGLEENALPCQVIPAGFWFAAELEDKSGHFALVGCTMSPGFDYMDFIKADPNTLIRKFPEHAELIKWFTENNHKADNK